MKKRNKIILIAIILLVSILLFYPKKIIFPITMEENISIIRVDSEELNKPGFFNSVRKVFGAPFDFQNYNLYIKTGKQPQDKDDCMNMELTYANIDFNEKINIVKMGETVKIGEIKPDETYEFSDKFEVNFTMSFSEKWLNNPIGPCSTKINPLVVAFAQPNLYETGAKMIIFTISGLALIRLLVFIRRWAVETKD